MRRVVVAAAVAVLGVVGCVGAGAGVGVGVDASAGAAAAAPTHPDVVSGWWQPGGEPRPRNCWYVDRFHRACLLGDGGSVPA